MKDFDVKEQEKFPWPGLFLVTGFSFFLFSLFLKYINYSYSNFLKVGLVSIAIGGVCLLYQLLQSSVQPVKTKRRRS
ncbi:MAG: hypothetical protein WDN26_03860 [Chitinophagaceae bacterium]